MQYQGLRAMQYQGLRAMQYQSLHTMQYQGFSAMQYKGHATPGLPDLPIGPVRWRGEGGGREAFGMGRSGVSCVRSRCHRLARRRDLPPKARVQRDVQRDVHSPSLSFHFHSPLSLRNGGVASPLSLANYLCNGVSGVKPGEGQMWNRRGTGKGTCARDVHKGVHKGCAQGTCIGDKANVE